MTSHDITFCANAEECPDKGICRRAKPPTDVEVYKSNFYEGREVCLFVWPIWVKTYAGGKPNYVTEDK